MGSKDSEVLTNTEQNNEDEEDGIVFVVCPTYLSCEHIS